MVRLPLQSARILWKHWRLTAIAVLSLSIAMALGILSLSITNTFLLLPPSAPQADQLVTIHGHSDSEAIAQISYPDFLYLRDHNHVFAGVTATPNSVGIMSHRVAGRPEIRVTMRPVSDNYFEVMGVRPHLGRFFTGGDGDAAVMTYTCWTRLGSDPHIVGKSIAGQIIVGVAPKDFGGAFYGFNGDLITRVSWSDHSEDWQTNRNDRRLFLTARLKPGVTRQQAQAELTALSAQLAAEFPKENRRRTAVLTQATLLPPDMVPAARTITAILTAVVLLVLLIACANVANLLLAVAVGRRQETSIKLALGASRGRLIRAFLAESTLLCAAGALFGYLTVALIVARYSTFSMTVPVYGSFSFSLHLKLDTTVAVFTSLLTLLGVIVTGLPPAIYASSPRVAQVLGGEMAVGGTGKRRLRDAIVMAQIAICTLACVGMGLFQLSLYNLRHTNMGFTARRLLAAQLPVQDAKVANAVLVQTIAALPGVESATVASDLPLFGPSDIQAQTPDRSHTASAVHTAVDQNYFATLGIPVLSGRGFNTIDTPGHPATIVINRKMADTFWPGQSPLGKQILVENPAAARTVIGVVPNGKYQSLDEPDRLFFYEALAPGPSVNVFLIAKAKGDPGLLAQPLTQALSRLHLELPMSPFTLDTWLNLSLIGERIAAAGISALGGLGLLLAVIGLFASISWSVSERKKELGIRVALGARPATLLRMILKATLIVTSAGVLTGIALGIGATLLMRSHLYGISAVELPVLITVAAAIVAIAMLIASLSARPWLTADPMDAVRHT